MKKYTLIILLITFFGIHSYAQCDKKVMLSANSTEYLNGKNEFQNKDDRAFSLEYDSKEISLYNGGDNTLVGKVDSITCNWGIPFKEGKTIIKATFSPENAAPLITTITILSKDGKIILIAETTNFPDQKLRFTLNKFEEKK